MHLKRILKGGLKGKRGKSNAWNLKLCHHVSFVFPDVLSFSVFSGMEEVVIVIQSQRNSHHARRGCQMKVEIHQEAARLGQVKFCRQSTT